MSRGTPDWGLSLGGLQAVAEFDTYCMWTATAVLAGTTRWVLSVFNPAGSGKLLTLHNALVVVQHSITDGTDNMSATLYRLSVSGAGTLVTPVKADTNSPASGAQWRTVHSADPTSSGVINSLDSIYERNVATAPGRISPPNDQLELYRHMPGSAEIPQRFRPGEGYGVQVIAGTLAPTVEIYVCQTERPL